MISRNHQKRYGFAIVSANSWRGVSPFCAFPKVTSHHCQMVTPPCPHPPGLPLVDWPGFVTLLQNSIGPVNHCLVNSPGQIGQKQERVLKKSKFLLPSVLSRSYACEYSITAEDWWWLGKKLVDFCSVAWGLLKGTKVAFDFLCSWRRGRKGGKCNGYYQDVLGISTLCCITKSVFKFPQTP